MCIIYKFLINNKMNDKMNDKMNNTRCDLICKHMNKIENIPSSVETINLIDNQITKIENIPSNVEYLHLDDNPCYDMINSLRLDEIKWMNNFDKNITILANYLILDYVNIIKKYSIYNCF